ncbi:MAG TPA: GDSL-type esterase/lipase family protein [Ferruginibacter sp.]|jgi:lysophospholipase L1-like esterase|nr:GDSL-type esterase/lipase family protein [Ferruginibacter sp.]
MAKKRVLIASILLNIVLIGFFIGKEIFAINACKKIEHPPLPTINHHLMRIELFQKMPIKQNNIVFLGNSLTQYFELAEFFQNVNIKNRGIAGDVTSGVLKRLNEITQNKPSKIFIEIGINDILSGLSTDSIYSNYSKIIDSIRIQSPETVLYIQSLLPTSKSINNNDSKALPHIIDLNTRLSSLCRTKKIIYIDLYSHFLVNNEINAALFSKDQLHLNSDGYILWKNLINEYVKN